MSDFFAFDFDGVVCKSAGESGLTAWRAAHDLWPGEIPATPPPEFVDAFPAVRPVIETGHELVALVVLMVQGLSTEEILHDFVNLREGLKARRGVDDAAMRAAFGKARDGWLKSDLSGWLLANDFYPGVVDAINALKTPRAIITTKEDRFVRALIEDAGIDVPSEHVFALESFEGGGKRSILAQLHETHPDHQLHFFEDRYKTLDGMRNAGLARLYLVDWGYNTASERERAAADDDIKLLDRAAFEALLAGASNEDAPA